VGFRAIPHEIASVPQKCEKESVRFVIQANLCPSLADIAHPHQTPMSNRARDEIPPPDSGPPQKTQVLEVIKLASITYRVMLA